MVIVLAFLSLDTDRPQVLVDELVVENFGIFTLNFVLSSMVLYDENNRPITCVFKVVSVVVDDIDFVNNFVVGAEEKLLAIFEQEHFRDRFLSLPASFH